MIEILLKIHAASGGEKKRSKAEPLKFGTVFINNLINIRYQGEFTTVNYIRDT